MLPEEKLQRLKWQSRRGMLELDLILLPFVENTFTSLSEEDQKNYEALLQCENQDLFGWFLSASKPEDPALKSIIEIIQSHHEPA